MSEEKEQMTDAYHTCSRSARKNKAQCKGATRIGNYDIDNSCNKHTHCKYCKLVCCAVCQGCTTRYSCKEVP